MVIRYIVAMSYTSRPLGMQLSGGNMILIKPYMGTYRRRLPCIVLPIDYTSMVPKLGVRLIEWRLSAQVHTRYSECLFGNTRQVTHATHVRNRVCPRVELILKIIIILLIIFLRFIKSKPC